MTTYDPSLENTLTRGQRLSSEDPTLAVVLSKLSDLREDVLELRAEVRASSANVVGRGEWVQRNAHVDGTFAGQGREIALLRTEIVQARTLAENRRAPWWSVMAAIGTAVAIAAMLIPALAP